MRDIYKLFLNYFSSKYIHIRDNKKKIPKNENASQGFSNKSKKPRKKNLMAAGNITTPNAIITPNTIRGNEFFICFIIISINYTTNIRKKCHISKSFLTFFSHFCTSTLCSPTHNHPKDTTFLRYIQINHMTICPNRDFYDIFNALWILLKMP